MSDDYEGHAGNFIAPEDFGAIYSSSSAISPDWTSNPLYAPINYENPGNSYTPVPTNPTGDHGAQDLNARLIREQYADYERRFKPIEDLAVSLLTPTGTKDLPFDIARTKEVVGGVFSSIQGQQDRAIERYGQFNKADAIDGSNSEATALVGGLNSAVFADQQRRMELLGGGSSAASAAHFDNGGQG